MIEIVFRHDPQAPRRPEPKTPRAARQLLERGIQPHTTVGAISRAGGTPAYLLADDLPAAVFGAETEAGARYWMGFNNFYVITRYNRSVNYALAVHELAQELRGLRQTRGLE